MLEREAMSCSTDIVRIYEVIYIYISIGCALKNRNDDFEALSQIAYGDKNYPTIGECLYTVREREMAG